MPCDPPSDCGAGERSPPQWEDFVSARVDAVRQLAEPVLECNASVDTTHPAFHGCFDWHSHVHAVWALHVAHRMTGDPAYSNAAEDTLQPAAIRAELDAIEAGQLGGELPYGYAWFLRLAIEREATTGHRDLHPMAEEIAEQLREWLRTRTPSQLNAGILGNDYDNVPWAVMNLWQWAEHVGDDTLSAELEELTTRTLMDPSFDQACPLSLDAEVFDEFFPPCLQRAMAIITVAPRPAAKAWLEHNLPEDFELVPLQPEEVRAVHHAGLNFTRAWGLWALWTVTEDPALRDAYVEHVQAQLAQPEHWRENYDAFSHWVPQFGIYALDLSTQQPS
jgi:hypothetical protein